MLLEVVFCEAKVLTENLDVLSRTRTTQVVVIPMKVLGTKLLCQGSILIHPVVKIQTTGLYYRGRPCIEDVVFLFGGDSH